MAKYFVLAVFFLAKRVVAQHDILTQETKANASFYSELRVYALKNIRPVLQQERAQLEKVLSIEEKERINDLRAEIKEVVLAAQEDTYSLTTGLYPDESSVLDIFLFFKANSVLIKKIFNDAWEIAEQHDDDIKKHLERIDSQKGKWKQDLKQIIKSNKANDEGGNHIVVPKQVFDRHFSAIAEPVFFLLWSEGGILFDYTQDNFLEESFISPRLSPNPVSDYFNVEFELRQPSLVILSLFDMQGKSLQSLEHDYQNPGLIKEQFDLRALGSGSYLVRIATRWDSTTIRFSKY